MANLRAHSDASIGNESIDSSDVTSRPQTFRRALYALLPHITRIDQRFAVPLKEEKCYCARHAVVRISWTVRNPGRRFYGCARQEGFNCDYFAWMDESFHPYVYCILNGLKKCISDMLEERNSLLDQSEIATMRREMSKLKFEMKQMKMKLFALKVIALLGVGASIWFAYQK